MRPKSYTWDNAMVEGRRRLAQTGTDITQWDRELAELDDPTRLFVSPMTIAVIATKT